MSDAVQDPRIKAGLDRQFADWRAQIRAGRTALGWKVGFGAPDALTRLKIAAPLTGYLLAQNVLPSGATCDLTGWVKPLAEPEIAVHLARDLAAGRSEDEARAAIGALAPAIELADVTFAPNEPEDILAANIYQRHLILGTADASRAGARLDGMTGTLIVDGEEGTALADLEANTGRIVAIVKHIADTLGAMGETLRAGQIIIAGSVVPPLFVGPQHREVAFRLDPIGTVSVRFAHGAPAA